MFLDQEVFHHPHLNWFFFLPLLLHCSLLNTSPPFPVRIHVASSCANLFLAFHLMLLQSWYPPAFRSCVDCGFTGLMIVFFQKAHDYCWINRDVRGTSLFYYLVVIVGVPKILFIFPDSLELWNYKCMIFEEQLHLETFLMWCSRQPPW